MTLEEEWTSATPDLRSEWDAAASAQSEKASVGERVSAGVSGLNRGVAGLLGLPVDTAENIYNLGKAGIGTATTALGRPDLAPELTTGTPGGSESIAKLMERMGVRTTNPRPDDPTSRILNTGGIVAGGSIVPGAGIKNTLKAATTAALGSEALGPEYAGIATMLPAAAGRGAAAIKNRVASSAAPVLKTFKQAGAQPSVGQVTDNTFFHGIENLATKFPGGAGVMQNFIKTQQANMGAQARTGVPSEAAGRAIEKGIRGEGGFVERFKANQEVLYGHLDKYIRPQTPVEVSGTVKALRELNAEIPNAPHLSEWFKNAKIRGIEGALGQDMAGTPNKVIPGLPERPSQILQETGTPFVKPGTPDQIIPGIPSRTTMPYESIKKLRTLVGRELADSSIISDVPKSKWKALYASLSEDLGVTAKLAGPPAEQAWSRANNYTKSGIARIDSVLDRVLGKGKQPEDIFKTVMPTDPDQANKFRAVMRSLSRAERQVVSEAAANRLGRVTPSGQDLEGKMFSSETFLTNWNKLSPGAKAQLFPDPPLRANMEKIASASAKIREGKGIYANPSGTAGSFAAYAVYMGPIAAVGGGLAGVPGAIAASASSATTAYLGSKMLTSPKIVEWLATPVRPSSPQAAAHLARLGVIYNHSDESTKEELARYIESISQ